MPDALANNKISGGNNVETTNEYYQFSSSQKSYDEEARSMEDRALKRILIFPLIKQEPSADGRDDFA